MVRYVLSEYEGPIVLHNAKFDAGMLMRDGLPFPWGRAHAKRSEVSLAHLRLRSLAELPEALAGRHAPY